MGSPDRGHPDLFRFSSDLRSLFSGIPRSVPICSDFFRFVPICFQNKSEQIRETPFADPLQFPEPSNPCFSVFLAFFVLRFSLLFCAFLLSFQGFQVLCKILASSGILVFFAKVGYGGGGQRSRSSSVAPRKGATLEDDPIQNLLLFPDSSESLDQGAPKERRRGRAEKRLSKRVFLESPFLLCSLKVFRAFQVFEEQTLRGQRRNGLSKNTLLDNRFSARPLRRSFGAP